MKEHISASEFVMRIVVGFFAVPLAYFFWLLEAVFILGFISAFV